MSDESSDNPLHLIPACAPADDRGSGERLRDEVLNGFDLAAKATRDQIIEMLNGATADAAASGSCGVNAGDGDPAVLFFAWGSWAPVFQTAIRLAVDRARRLTGGLQAIDRTAKGGADS